MNSELFTAVFIGHIVQVVQDALSPIAYYLWAALAIALALSVLHLRTKHKGTKNKTRLMPWLAAALIGLVAIAIPGSATADEPGVVPGMPDLISEPPLIWRNSTVFDQALQKTIRAMTFDGTLTNIGEGSLDLQGNPQIEGDVVQRIWDGEEWEVVKVPTVRFETDDGHNHFHLIGAVEYSLWSEDRSDQIVKAAKTGFCLVDMEQREPGYEGFYSLNRFNYCEVDDPGSEHLRMGITPGWADVYDANITMQWVDISNVKPGRYWIGAITDPNNEIIESNEENNELVFSYNKWPVDGYVSRDLEIEAKGAEVPVELKSYQYGVTGTRYFVITKAPEHGSLNVATGFDYFGSELIYTPEPGYVGEDSFEYEAHNLALPYPFDASVATVELTVDASNVTEASAQATMYEPASEETGSLEGLDALKVTMFQRVEHGISLDSAELEVHGWYSKGLPNGLWIDAETGVIQGFTDVAGSFDVTVAAVTDEGLVSAETTLDIEEIEKPYSVPSHDTFVSYGSRVELAYGVPEAGYGYRATGLPVGMSVPDTYPLVVGVPRSLGTYGVQVGKVDMNGAVIFADEINLTVIPSIVPAFE